VRLFFLSRYIAGVNCSVTQDSPAWVVSRAQQYALDHGITPFCIYQGQWNLTKRSFEREIIPMARELGLSFHFPICDYPLFSYCRSLGLALAPWDVLASGRFRTDAEEKARQESGEKSRTFTPDGKAERNEEERKMCTALEKIAGEIGSKSIQAGASLQLSACPFLHL
jgi:aryl-alcohol dehydrogenase-like predicted oxidoreductase